MFEIGICGNCESVGELLNGLCCDCARLRQEGEFDRESAWGLERVFCEGHQYYNRIFYDSREGSYYDRGSDRYLTLEDMGAFCPLFRV